jgi:hypothetical protein
MSKVVNSLSRYSKVLKAKFEATKASATDSHVKGGLNEDIVAKFLEDTVPNWFVSTNSQIIDSNENITDEQDICVCNNNQFFMQPDSGLLIAEGVDFVVQVKAKITDSELNRAIKSCTKVKEIKRKSNQGDTVYSNGILPPEWFDYIPYFCFAFSSELQGKTIAERLNTKYKDIDVTKQIDALFVLDKGITLINGKDGRGHRWRNKEGNLIQGWHALTTNDATLVEFMRYCIDHVPRFTRTLIPSSQYFPDSKYSFES